MWLLGQVWLLRGLLEAVAAEVVAGAVSWGSFGLSPWVILDFPVLSEAATRHSVVF